ncbi:hypothetical protein [Eubacterium sp.]|uniref:hypothetical protein n=1 Tax=Eubacterium sp. TaxID=142586 RepID=UPI0026E085E4|nr:hypothetical protein [Eubacterium sp.]MDO5434482.1 hypothetical protein [Eubacterium sp.]
MTALFIFLINLVVGLANKVFPSFDYVGQTGYDFKGNINTVIEWLNAVNFLVPLEDIFSIIFLVMAIHTVEWGAFVANWIVRRIVDAIP